MLGIDVSKETLSCAFIAAATRRCAWEMTVPNTAQGVRQLLARTPSSDPWVVEPTGIYSQRVVQQGQAAGRSVLLAQPKRAKAFLAAIQPRAKTDRVDSRGLALYGLSAVLRPFPVKSEAMEQIDQILAARKGIGRALASLRQQRAALPHAAAPLTAAITALTEQQAVIDRQLVAVRDVLPVVSALREIPGIGPVTASAVAVCLTTKQFDHPDQFVAYIGLDTRVRESGQRQARRALTKQGDAELRRLLYLCAQANVRSRDPENPFTQQYEREKAKGLTTTGALCAVARKLARTCWSLERHGTHYEGARVHRQPTTGT
ncbi:MAG: transposase, partial [Thermomicrobia bacterium]|nr:transposase [Thermomicrobia bacterium]